MRKSDFKKIRVDEGLADLADAAERDHEVQMARAELYKIAKYAVKLHEMLKTVSEAEGLEGWVQAKITKSADYISSVYHHLDYDMKFGDPVAEGKSPHKKGTKKYKDHMAAMHANMESYKDTLAQKLQEEAQSAAQQRLFGMAYAVRKGEMPRSEASGAVLKIADGDMSTAELKKYASTKHSGKPEHVGD